MTDRASDSSHPVIDRARHHAGSALTTVGLGGPVSRRQAIGVIGVTTAVMIVASEPAAAGEGRVLGDSFTRRQMLGGERIDSTPQAITAAFSSPAVRTVRFVRPEDQLDVTIELFDVVIDGDEFSDDGPAGAVRLTFGSQHTAETGFQAMGAITPPTTAVDHMAARNSQVVAPVTGTHQLTVDGILALVQQALIVQATAGPTDTDTTILEIPAGLSLSPDASTTMHASGVPFTVGDTTELWLADLQSDGREVDLLAVENLANSDLIGNSIPTAVHRDNLVTNTTTGPAISASELTLSSSGAFARLEGNWPSATLTSYRQHITTGRDISVEIETTGYLAPFGIRAAITTTTKRVFAKDTTNELTSAMRIERYLTILEPSVDLGDRDHQLDGGRRNLWVNVAASTDETREITTIPIADGSGDIPGVDDVLRLDDGSDVVIDYVATDRNGADVTFSMPATYITADVAHSSGGTSSSNRFAAVWNGGSRDARRDIALNGQRVAFADPIAVDQTSKSGQTIRFDLDIPEPGTPGGFFGEVEVPAFNPSMNFASITDEILGGNAPFDVTLHPRWLDFGIGTDNFDLSFLRLGDPQLGKIGGDLPTKSVAAIEVVGEIFNQVSGAAPDLPSIDVPWDAAEALGSGSKLLGSLLLSELMDLVPPELAVPGIDIPNTEIITSEDGVTIIYSFKPKLKTIEALGFIANPNTRCCVTITTDAPFVGEPSVITETVVDDFTLVFPPGNVIEIIRIDFDFVNATVASNSGLSVTPKIRGWELGDDLNFLQPIFDTLATLGGLAVDVGSEYLDLDAAVNLPSLGFGIVSLSNFHIDFGLGLPLNGDPVKIGAGVGSPSDLIEVAAGFFGGSFFTTLDVEYHESLVDWRVAAGISLFAEIGFDAVVVDASVRLRCALDFVFNRDENGGDIKVTGSVSLEGEVNVLGLVEVSVKVVASITYKSGPQIATAKGTIHWGVDTFLGGLDGKVKLGRIDYELGDDDPPAAAARSRVSAPNGAEQAALVSTTTADGDAASSAQSISAATSAASSSGPSSAASFGDLVSLDNWTDYSNAFA